jgi:hypothetical protein
MLNYKYYRFPDKENTPLDEQWPEGVSVNHVGLISNNDGVYDERGFEIKPPTYKPGWHVNVTYQGYVNLKFVEPFEISVKTPRQIWLGQTTN